MNWRPLSPPQPQSPSSVPHALSLQFLSLEDCCGRGPGLKEAVLTSPVFQALAGEEPSGGRGQAHAGEHAPAMWVLRGPCSWQSCAVAVQPLDPLTFGLLVSLQA